MVILSNCLTETADEGCLNVANSLVKRIKKKAPDTTMIISYERKSSLTDLYIDLNKFLISKELKKIIKEKNEDVLYIPFPAKMRSTALRIFNLSIATKKRVRVAMAMTGKMDLLAKFFLKLSGAEIVVFSEDVKAIYESVMGEKKVKYLTLGVDTERFVPVTGQRAVELKKKYGFDSQKKIVLHVGHLRSGRNIVELMKISDKYQVILVTSTLTKCEQDMQLRQEILDCKNITIIDDYVPNIQELYQLADVYFFPVASRGHCIDVPLSCLEAASCNTPVVTTDYGEMKAFKEKNGFFFIENFDKTVLNTLIDEAAECENVETRKAVLCYDWDRAVNYFAGG